MVLQRYVRFADAVKVAGDLQEDSSDGCAHTTDYMQVARFCPLECC